MVCVIGLYFWASDFQWKHNISSSHLLLRLLYEINSTNFMKFSWNQARTCTKIVLFCDEKQCSVHVLCNTGAFYGYNKVLKSYMFLISYLKFQE